MQKQAVDEWIGVAEVAEEMRVSIPTAWELIRRWGVPVTDPRPKVARFRRSDFETLREANLKAPPPRAVLARRVAATSETPKLTQRKTEADIAKIDALRSGRGRKS